MFSDIQLVHSHDHYFRRMMSDPKVVREFFSSYLPVNVRNAVNFDTIVQQQGSYISEELKKQEVDLLFSVEFNGKSGYLYCLLEHQSVPDKLMAFRLLKYMVAIMEDHLKKTKKGQLPIVYPIVIYSGWKEYKYSTSIFDLFGEDKKLAQDILFQPFKLIDLSKSSDDELKENMLYGIVARMLKHAHEKNTLNFLKEIVKELRAIEKTKEMDYIYTTLSYIISAYDISKEDFIELVRTELPLVPEERLMTIAEQYRQEGLKEGLKEGYQKGQLDGIEKGRIDTLNDVALNLIRQGMENGQVAKATGLDIVEIYKLRSMATAKN